MLTPRKMTYWTTVSSIDMLVDLALVALPIAIVWDLQMHWQTKSVVVLAFAFRPMYAFHFSRAFEGC